MPNQPHFHHTRMGQQHYALLERNLGRIAASLEELVNLQRQSLGLAAEEDQRRCEELQDEYEALGPLFREFTDDESADARKWARDNYKPGDKVDPLWHPVVRNEINKINMENGLS